MYKLAGLCNRGHVVNRMVDTLVILIDGCQCKVVLFSTHSNA